MNVKNVKKHTETPELVFLIINEKGTQSET